MLRLLLAALLLAPQAAWAVHEAGDGGGGAPPAGRASIEGVVVHRVTYKALNGGENVALLSGAPTDGAPAGEIDQSIANAPIEGALFTVAPRSAPKGKERVSAKTDAHGHFTLHGLAPGEYEYRLTGGAFQPMDGAFTAKPKDALKRNFFVQQYNKFYGVVKEAASRAGGAKPAQTGSGAGLPYRWTAGGAGEAAGERVAPEPPESSDSSDTASENGDPGFLAAVQSPDVAGSKPPANTPARSGKGSGKPGQPVSGAEVRMKRLTDDAKAPPAKSPTRGKAPAKSSEPERTTRTDGKGSFDFGHVEDGVFEVTISKNGFRTLRTKLDIAHWHKQDFELEAE